ncbi:MAG TPA: hypothetical protein VF807_01390, partial [Ktedonobacterales bacterium]
KCPKIGVQYRAGVPDQAAAANLYIQQWQAAMPGLRVTTVPIERGSCHVLGSCLAQLSPLSWQADYPDPQDFLSLLVHTGSPYNQSGISLPAADTLLDQADANPNQAARLAQYQQAEQLLVNAVAWIPIGQSMNAYVVRPRVARGYHERASEQTALAVWQRLFLAKK